MRTQESFIPSQLPNCTFCGLAIRRGLQVQLNKKNYHPGCAVRVANDKENKVASTKQTTQQR